MIVGDSKQTKKTIFVLLFCRVRLPIFVRAFIYFQNDTMSIYKMFKISMLNTFVSNLHLNYISLAIYTTKSYYTQKD